MNDKTESSTTRSRAESLARPAREELDLSAESVITIQPDGRIHLFGITPAAVEVLASIPCADPAMSRRLGRMLSAARRCRQQPAISASAKEASRCQSH